MNINAKDLALIGKSKDNLRDALGEGLDAISDMTVERLTGGDAVDALSIVAEVDKLNTLLAAVVVWNFIYTSTEAVLNSPQQPTMQQVIDLVDKDFAAALDSTLLQKAKPEFYPYLIVAYGVALKHLRFIDSAGTFAESVADEIDADNDWAPGQALDAMKDNDPDVIEQAKEVAARRAVREIASRGFTPEQLVAVRKVATGLGIDADKIGLPPVDLRAAELDGGCDNLPRGGIDLAAERSVPRYADGWVEPKAPDNADGVDRRPIIVINPKSREELRRSMQDFLARAHSTTHFLARAHSTTHFLARAHSTTHFPAEARNFGQRPAA